MSAQLAIPFEHFTLPNGLAVVLHRDTSVAVAAVVVMYHVGSKNERPGRTGFAHLFEHMMFKGSAHVPDGDHFRLLQEIGASINGTTSEDRTNYFEVVPSNYLELALYLESDRMGYLLPALTQDKLDNQRDVVKNERRQNYDNQPYGRALEMLAKSLFPPNHPYSWPVIGSMEDLSAATLEDIKKFFTAYYSPGNACIAVAGNFQFRQVKEWIQKYFGDIPPLQPPASPLAPPFSLSHDVRFVEEDSVQLPRLYAHWRSAKAFTREDAIMDVFTDILSSGKNSRLYKILVYERQVAQSVTAYQYGSEIDGIAGIQITPKPGRTLKEMETAMDEQLREALDKGVIQREIETAVNNKETSLVVRLSTALGKANGLATARTLAGDPMEFNREFDRYSDITPDEVASVAGGVFGAHRVVLSIVPRGRADLAATNGEHTTGIR